MLKKLILILSCITLLATACVPAGAMDGASVMEDAEVFITFETGIVDVKGKHTITVHGDSPLSEGQHGQGLLCEGGRNWLTIEDMKVGKDSFTVTMWARDEANRGADGDDPVLFGTQDWSTKQSNGFALVTLSRNIKYDARCEGGARLDFEAAYSVEIKAAEWYHLALVVDREAKTVGVYVNADLLAFMDYSAYEQAETYDGVAFNIGNDAQNYNAKFPNTFKYRFDDIAVFNRALTEDELYALADYVPGEEANPVVPVTPEAPETAQPLVTAASTATLAAGAVVLLKKRK